MLTSVGEWKQAMVYALRNNSDCASKIYMPFTHSARVARKQYKLARINTRYSLSKEKLRREMKKEKMKWYICIKLVKKLHTG